MTRQEAIDELHKHYVPEYVNYIVTALTDGATPSDAPTLKQEPCDDTVSRGVFEQVMWERDTAIEQLRKLGYELGQKIEHCDDVLDKIRAEIEQNAYPIVHGVNNHEKGMTLYGILQIIDKYRKEQTDV